MADLTEALRRAHEAQPDPPAARLLELALRRAGARPRLALYRALQECGATAALQAALRLDGGPATSRPRED